MPFTAQFVLAFPVLALMLLTAVVWGVMYWRRLTAIVRLGINPQALASPDGQAQLPDAERRAADNFRNLCEAPVIFYALCLLLMVLDLVDGTYVLLAWLYVLSRILHSAIHIAYNRVTHRFTVYFLGTLVLWGMAGRLLWQLPA